MEHLTRYLSIILFITLPCSANTVSVYPSGIEIFPTPQTTDYFLVAEINGSYSTPGYTLDYPPLLNISGNTINIGIFVTAPTEIVPFVLVPFSHTVGLGKFDEGVYDITANFFVNGSLDNSISDMFSVSQVPIPAALWLFVTGLYSLVGLNKLRNKA